MSSHYSSTVWITDDEIEWRGWRGRQRLAWSEVVATAFEPESLVLVSASGRRHLVDLEMKNVHRLACDLDARFPPPLTPGD